MINPIPTTAESIALYTELNKWIQKEQFTKAIDVCNKSKTSSSELLDVLH